MATWVVLIIKCCRWLYKTLRTSMKKQWQACYSTFQSTIQVKMTFNLALYKDSLKLTKLVMQLTLKKNQMINWLKCNGMLAILAEPLEKTTLTLIGIEFLSRLQIFQMKSNCKPRNLIRKHIVSCYSYLVSQNLRICKYQLLCCLTNDGKTQTCSFNL